MAWLETIKPGEIPTIEQLQELYMPNWCYLDFEKLAEEYDAVELRNSHLFRTSLSTWDCDCILVGSIFFDIDDSSSFYSDGFAVESNKM